MRKERYFILNLFLRLCSKNTDDATDDKFLFLATIFILIATYGVVYQHFPIVGEALLHALEQALGDDFTPEVRESWGTVYGVITEHMSTGMRDILGEEE